MRTIIVGNSGSGKTWLATRLATEFGAPVFHLDDLFWEPGGFDKKRSADEVDRLIAESKSEASWIVEGVFGELAERYSDEAELLIWLDIPWNICKARLLARGSESKRHLGREQSEDGLKRLLDWASHYYDRTDLRSFAGHRSLLENFSGKTVRLSSEEDVNRFSSDD
jgi:adenylate kinase family enzyme